MTEIILIIFSVICLLLALDFVLDFIARFILGFIEYALKKLQQNNQKYIQTYNRYVNWKKQLLTYGK